MKANRLHILAAVLGLGLLHAALGFLAGAALSPSINAALYATNLYVIYCAWGLTSDESSIRLGLFVLGYFVLFLLVMLLLDRKPLFILLVIVYASVFRSTLLLGLFGLFVLSFVVLQPYAFETFVPLGCVFVILYRARTTSPFHRLMLGIGLVALTVVLFPIIHLAFQDSAQTLIRTLERPDVREAIWLSVASSTVATLLIALWGIPLAYALARTEFSGKRIVESIIDVPILVPQSVVGIAMLVLLGRGSPLGQALDEVLGVQVAGRFLGIVLAQTFVGAPFLIKSALTAFEAVPVRLELASRTLGASASATFRRIALPLASRGVLIGMVLAWARAISEFGSVSLFAASPVSAPILVNNEFLRAGATESRPIAVLLLIICVWIFVLLQFGQTLLPFGMQKRSGTKQ